MRLTRHIIFILLLVSFTFNTVNAQVSYNSPTVTTTAAMINHTVKMGETAYSIATAYQTTVEEIYRLNPDSKQKINVGQILRVPNNISTSAQSYGNEVSHKHIILAKETLFSVSKQYNITVAELLRANPGLNETNFGIGKEINIPEQMSAVTVENNVAQLSQTSASAYEHKVEKQETLYSISKKYDCTITEILNANPRIKEVGLQEGSIVYIPLKKGANEMSETRLTPVTLDTNQTSFYLPQDGVVRVALLLPFIEGSKTVSVDRITEYYEGFLLAVQRMKEKGLNAEIYTFDIGSDSDTRRLESILGTNELNSLNLVIGGVSDKQVQLISKFSQNTGVKYVVPFSNKNTGVNHNKYMFQVANSHTALFPKVVRSFVATFANANIIILSEPGSDNNKNDFVKELQKGLQEAKVPYRTAPTGASILDNMNAVIDRSRQNIIVPTSSSEATLKRIMDVMPVVTKSQNNISLFGYPEWQAYVNKSKKLHTYNSYMYSMFYLDTLHPEVQLFGDRYKRWYNKNFLSTLPRYAHMGYDTGLVFLTALQQLGHDFSTRISDINVPTLQSSLYFEPVGTKGGYINTGLYIINLKPDGSVVKNQIGK